MSELITKLRALKKSGVITKQQKFEMLQAAQQEWTKSIQVDTY